MEHEGFNYYMNVVELRFPIPSCVTVAKDCIKLYLNYLLLTCHFIDSDWKYQKRILKFCLVPNHKGETIGKVVEKCLREWSINIILTIIVDNVSSNDVTTDYLRRKMKLKKSCIVGCEFLHMRCCSTYIESNCPRGIERHP